MAQPGSPQSSDGVNDNNSTFESFIAPRDATGQLGLTFSTINEGTDNQLVERDIWTRPAMQQPTQSVDGNIDEDNVSDPYYYSNQGP
jgi:hypothetical protein